MAIDGTYDVEIDTPMGKQEAKLTVKADGGNLTGTMENDMGKNDISGTIKNNDVSWGMELNSPMGNMKLEFSGKVTGGEITGEVKLGAFGTAPFKGRKV
jgi:hypothetical protein